MGDIVFGKFSVAVVTPFKDAAEDASQLVDVVGLKSVITHVASGLQKVRNERSFVGGIIVSGTTGEQHTMTIEERCELYAASVSIANQFDVSVAAGIAHTTVAGVVQLTKAALNAGCAGIMLGLPPYTRLCDEEIRVYIMAVKSLLPADLPLLLYNNSMRNGYGPSLALLAELCNDNTLWGIKHATAPENFHHDAHTLLQLAPNARLYTGSDKMIAELLHPTAPTRFHGLTSIVGNLYPEQTANMVMDLASPDPSIQEMGLKAHHQLVPAIDAVLTGTSLPVGLKYAMRCNGVHAGHTRAPVGHISEAKKAEIELVLKQVAL